MTHRYSTATILAEAEAHADFFGSDPTVDRETLIKARMTLTRANIGYVNRTGGDPKLLDYLIPFDTAQKRVDALFASHNFTQAGGMWGDAQWKQASPTTVVSVADDNGEGCTRPFDEARPTLLFVYQAPFVAGWKIEDGEAPCEDADNVSRLQFANAADALAYVESLS